MQELTNILTHVVSADVKTARANILAVERLIQSLPTAVGPEDDLVPVKHSFGEGLYIRELFIPAGVVVVGVIHKYAHPYFLTEGEILVFTELSGPQHLTAPATGISQPGTKRVGISIRDTVWVTVHATTLTDPHEIMETLTVKSYEELEESML